jgi:hypothetical protein
VLAKAPAASKPAESAPQPRSSRSAAAPLTGVRSSGGGEPLPSSVAVPISSSLGIDVSPIRVHSGPSAASVAASQGAHAFAHGTDIVLGSAARASDLPVMAHEVAHVVQQQSAPRVQLWSPGSTDRFEQEAHQASAAVVQGRSFRVRERTTPRVQRWPSFPSVLDFIAEKANIIPGFRMFTIVLGVNPINMSAVDSSPENILRAIVEFMPGGFLITQALDAHGILGKVAAWIAPKLKALGGVGSSFKAAIDAFIAKTSLASAIKDPGGTWERAKRIFTDPIDKLKAFAKSAASEIWQMVQDAILKPIAALAAKTDGWPLLCAVLGKNPITGEEVPRNPETVITAFLVFAGQQDIVANMKKANSFQKAWGWFQGAMKSLLGFVSAIPGLAIAALKALSWEDIVLLPRAFKKIAGVFGGFASSFISWAINAGWNLLEIVFDAVKPGAMSYVKKTGAALKSILKNPLPFVGNLVKAAKGGFTNFASGFLGHLKAGLLDWLTGSLPGVYIPKAFSIPEVAKFAFSVFGISWANVRVKLVKAVGADAVSAMETGFEIVKKLVTEGPAAAWAEIKEVLSNLKDMVIGGITDFVVDTIKMKAIPKVVAMFIPGAGFIAAIVSIYDTVMVFVQKMSKIMAIVTGFIDSIVAIAGGNITAAAKRVESVLANGLSLAISFLAGFAGLGKVADKVMGVINKARAKVDTGIDKLVAWVVAQAKRLGKMVVQKVRDWWKMRARFSAADRKSHSVFFQGQGAAAKLTVASVAMPVKAFLATVRAAATGTSATPAVRAAHASATALLPAIDALQVKVNAQPTPRQPQDVDDLNAKLLELAGHLPPLVSLQYPPPVVPGGPPGVPATGGGVTTKAHVGMMIRVKSARAIAKVTQAGVMVNWALVRPGNRMVAAAGRLASVFDAEWGKEFSKYTADPRNVYLGKTPGKNSPIGALVKARMASEGKYRKVKGVEEVSTARTPKGVPLPAGAALSWVPVAQCDMGHIVDAVAWWNSNGFLHGAQMPPVLTFMNDPNNYEIEPSASNRARGARLGATYVPPAV